MRLAPDKKKVNFINEAGDNNKEAYNNFERIFFVLALLIIGAFGLAISIPLFCLAQMRKLLLYTKRGKGRVHVTRGKVDLKAVTSKNLSNQLAEHKRERAGGTRRDNL